MKNHEERIKKLEQYNTSLLVELTHLQSELASVTAQRNNLFGQLEQFATFRSQLRMVIIGLYRKLLFHLDRLNQPVRPKRVIQLPAYDKRIKPEQLAKIAMDYDCRALRESRILSGKARHLIYRIFKSALRIFIKVLKWGVRLVRRAKRAI